MESSSGMKRRDFLAQTTALSLGAAALPNLGLTSLNAGAQPAAVDDKNIASVAIYPPIGMSRVGNAPATDVKDPNRKDLLATRGERWYYAPEMPNAPANPSGLFKDGENRIKKQVQRYRLYALNSNREVIGELVTNINAAVKEAVTLCPGIDEKRVAEGMIEVDEMAWSFHIANTKPAWYNFNNPPGLGRSAPYLAGEKRNMGVIAKEDREGLVVDAGQQTLAADGSAVTLTGKFGKCFKLETEVPLGIATTDEAGRMLMFPGNGLAASVVPGSSIESFTSNDGWYDDWADGWLQGAVVINGREYATDKNGHAWMACCGPDFAPAIAPYVTLYDVAYDAMYRKNLVQQPKEVSFTRDIYPFFNRLALTEWVANAANLRQAWMNIGDFTDPTFIAELAKKGNGDLRKQTFALFRGPRVPTSPCGTPEPPAEGPQGAYKLPFLLGSGVNYASSPDHWFRMPKYHYELLQRWAEGDYVDDWKGAPAWDMPDCLEALPPEMQTQMLARAALDPCSGTGFHPGVELTWPLERAEIYADDPALLFRIMMNTTTELQQDLGRLLTEEIAFCGKDNVLGPQKAGDMTRWLGIPWQPDAFSCQQVLYGTDFPVSVWWPALLPIDVLPEGLYTRMACPEISVKQRLNFYYSRFPWSRGVAGIGYHASGSYLDGLNRMVDLWPRMGFVVPKPRPWAKRQAELEKKGGLSPSEKKELDDMMALNQFVPETLFVETERGSMDELNVDEPFQVPPCQ